MTRREYTADPDIAYLTYGKANPGWCFKAVGRHGEEGVGLTPDAAIADFHRRKVSQMIRKILGASRRPGCNTDKLLRGITE